MASEIYKNPIDLSNALQSSDVVYKFPNYSENAPKGKVRLYHQTTLPKIKEILKSRALKGDVWGQEKIDNWNYGDYAIAYDVDPKTIHRANETDRIIYGDVPFDSFAYIKAMTPRTPSGIENLKKELENGD